jgi:hypothetical protein
LTVDGSGGARPAGAAAAAERRTTAMGDGDGGFGTLYF